MEINTDFFKTTLKTLQEKLGAALQPAKQMRTEFSKRWPQDAFTKFVANAKNRRADLLFWLRENAFLKNSRVFFKDTYARVVVRQDCTKRDLIALFILAVILGAGIKSVATETITIGFDDYTLAPEETLYDLNAVQQKLIDEGGTPVGSSVAPVGACSQ
jgi:hypothetical protein